MKKYLLATLGLLLGASVAIAGGIFVNGMVVATPPLSGLERLGADTQLPQGAVPQSEAISVQQLTQGTQTTVSSTTSFSATAAEVSGAQKITLLLTGLPSSGINMTTPTATEIINNLKATLPAVGNASGYSYLLKVVNVGGTSSGIVTVVGGTGVTVTGNATVAVAGSRTFLVSVTNVASPAVTFQDYGN